MSDLARSRRFHFEDTAVSAWPDRPKYGRATPLQTEPFFMCIPSRWFLAVAIMFAGGATLFEISQKSV